MGKTIRKTKLDGNFGSKEGYFERSPTIRRIFWNAELDEIYRQYDDARWEKRHRDGRAAHYNRMRGGGGAAMYRHMTNKLIRGQTRQKLKNVIANDNWDDTVFPTNRDAKKYIWAVW